MTSIKKLVRGLVEYEGTGDWIYTRRNFEWAYDSSVVRQLPWSIRAFCVYVRLHNALVGTPTLIFGHGLFQFLKRLDTRHQGPVEVLLSGRRACLNISDPGAMWAIQELSIGSAQSEVIRQIVAEADVFVDVGANQGIFSAIASSTMRRDGEIIAIEPQPSLARCVERTLSHSSIREWSVIEKIVSDSPGELQLEIPGENLGEAHVSASRGGRAESITVSATTLDVLLAHVRQDQKVVLKIDVEGAELAALKGARAFLARCKPTMMMEINPDAMERYGYTPGVLAEFLEEIGYRSWALTAETRTLGPISTLPSHYCDVVLDMREAHAC